MRPAKLTAEDKAKIRKLHATGVGMPELCKRFGVAHSTVFDAIHRPDRKKEAA